MFEIEVTAPEEVEAGEETLFTCRAKDRTTPLKHVLWDFGRGLPSVGAETSVVFHRLPPGPLKVTVLAWDALGNVAVADVPPISVAK